MTAVYYTKIVAIISESLGPASERFVNRQISFHLEKKPEDLTKEDVTKMAEWIRAPLNLLTSDTSLVDDVVNRIYAIVS